MLKFLFFIIFLIPLSCLGFWWLVPSLLFFIFFFIFFSFDYYCFGISYFMCVDYISYSLILLSLWICCLMILASGSLYNLLYYYNLFIFFLLMLLIFLFFSFSVNNLIMFYIFFESSLIPTLFLIMGWGYQPERIQAGLYFIFYTLFSSLPMLISIILLYMKFGSVSFILLCSFDYNYFLFYFCMIFSFLVKMPMFMVHIWLPSAHVEAPVSGSMILAGVLLKLGGYGLYRVSPMLMISGLKYNYLFVSISLLGGIYISLVCIRQVDLKSLIAYSSVIHMGLVLCGILTFNYWGIYGSLVLMLSHGLCSSGLFCLSNIIYERLGSRSLLILKGLLGFMPSMSLWWFFLSIYNMAAPPSLNLMGEIMLFNSIISWYNLNTLFFLFLSFFSAVYSLYMYSYTQHGISYSGCFSYTNCYLREYLLMFLHWFPLNVLIFLSNMFFV
uniref:NADH-ubiquinone oxidoreductase chain 4 n=2 Tax=Phraortes TaxID=590989 RepID=E2RUR3_PHRIL|nr:NADH dehydrogenase subunit 4 [Phraortes illepidus]YP_010601346.1 NADH dehydrogenase subunit 4 [Phraortes lii]WAL35425.1 NADH dehydrogenase subunit 4 [Phraortes lii]BAJ24447.1 NADH dehydrogenase subunit 4 [Phraortes illepidus]